MGGKLICAQHLDALENGTGRLERVWVGTILCDAVLEQQQTFASGCNGECNLRNELARLRHAVPHVIQELGVDE